MGFFIALQFLTTLPSPIKRHFDASALGRSQAYFPIVGLLLGVILALLDTLLRAVLPLPLSSALLVIASILLTGALHMDGLIDTCDGLFVQRNTAERLEIMRDSRVGSFGAVGAAALLLLKFAAVSNIPVAARPFAIVLAPVLARWAMVYTIAAFPYARASGKGTAFQVTSRLPLLIATLATLALAVVIWPERGLFLLAAVAIWTWLAARFIVSRIGGLTGDSYGAIGETAETLVLLGAAALWTGLW